MKKKILIAVLILAITLSICLAITLGVGAEKADPALSIGGKSLILGNSIYLRYMIAADNVADIDDVSLLIWNEPQDRFVKGTEKYEVKWVEGTTKRNNITYYHFEFQDVAAKRLADNFYAVVYTKVGDKEFYSAPNKYSVLQYAYNMMGKLDKAASTNTNLLNMLDAMLDYGATAQYYFDNYRIDRLANADFYQVKTVNGKLDDGFAEGLYLEGDLVNITADAPAEGYEFIGWQNKAGKIVSTDAVATITVDTANEAYTAVYEKESSELTVTKESSHKYLKTVHPGDDITYTFTVKNGTNENKQFAITDTVPANTTYKSGDATVNGNALTISVSAKAKETVTVSYTVTVGSDLALRGNFITSNSAEYLGNALDCEDVYIASTFNENDMEKLANATAALRGSEFKNVDFLKYCYYIGFGLSNAIGEDASAVANALFIDSSLENSVKYSECVIPGLYGGKKMNSSVSARLLGEPTDSITADYVFPGDVVIVLPVESDLAGAKFYITDGINFYDITGKCTDTLAETVINSISTADYFAVLRPIMRSSSIAYFRTQPLYQGETDVEKAIVAAANAFILRGARMQYDDKYMATSVPRWERNKTPEEYTVDEIGYSDCTGFIHDVYYTALGWDYGSKALYNMPSSWFVYDYYLTNNETEEDIAAIKEEFMATLKPGDIVYYRYSTNNHGMLYLGNGTLAHCTGNTYTYSGTNAPYENQEAAVRYQNVETLFVSGTRYLFQTDKPRSRFFILRPTNVWTGSVPEESLNRVENMQGIVAEKLSSHPLGQTVNRGGLITYTFKIFNSNNYAVSLNVKDVVPAGTSLMIGGNLSEETNLSWTVDLLPGEEKLISYTVKVAPDLEDGYVIKCSPESSVGGVPVKSTAVYVGRTLTEEEQAKLVEAVYASINQGVTSSDLVDKIYETAFGVEDIIGVSVSTVRSQLFLGSGTSKTLASEGKYAEMVAPTLYGGKNVTKSTVFDGERTRFVWERNLVVGDILYLQSGSGYFYMYIGDGKFVDMNTFKNRDAFERLEEAIGWQEFAILRPSLAFEE